MTRFERAIEAPHAPDFSAASPLGAAALYVALGELGVSEEPPGSNRGARVDQYMLGVDGHGDYLLKRPGLEWCGRCAVWCVDRGAATLCGCARCTASQICAAARHWREGAGDLASALKWSRWAQERGRWHKEPRPGRIGVMLSLECARGHVDIVSRLDGSDVLSIDGNSDHRVRMCRRPVSSFAGFVEVG